MRWFKHLANAHNDEKLVEILDEFGPEGYGVWWLLIETVAKEMDSSDRCDLSYPMAKWAKSLCCSKKKTAVFLQKFAEIPRNSQKKLIFLEYDGEDFTGKLKISIPNILKFRDEYSKKSGQSPDKKRRVSGAKTTTTTDRDRDRDREEKPLLVSELSDLYRKYAGVNMVNGGQVVVFQEWIKLFSRKTIIESMEAAASRNVSVGGFITWCRKRMDRTSTETEGSGDKEACGTPDFMRGVR